VPAQTACALRGCPRPGIILTRNTTSKLQYGLL